MPEIQKSIYYLTGESLAATHRSWRSSRRRVSKSSSSTQLEAILKSSTARSFCELKRGELEETDEEKKVREAEVAEFTDLCSAVKEALGDKVEKVIISNRITDSPCVLVTGQFGWSSNMVSVDHWSFFILT
jgi:molecular chaperone HtpG